MGKDVRKRRPNARPREILTAALDLFSERGFTATRLEDVAARAGLSKGAVYLYFEDKTALLKAIVKETADANIESVRELLESHQDPVAPLLQKLLEALAARLSGSRLPDVIKLVVSESRAHPEIGRLYLENVIGRAVPMIQSLIERGVSTGEFRSVDPGMTVRCVVGPLLLAAFWRSVFEPIGAEPLDIEALARQHAELIIRGLSANSPSAEATP